MKEEMMLVERHVRKMESVSGKGIVLVRVL